MTGCIAGGMLQAGRCAGLVACAVSVAAVAAAASAAAAATASPGAARNELAEPGAADERPVVRRALFLGNSITLHGPLAAIGWHNNWGMAATAQEKDYVHLVLTGIAAAQDAAVPESMVRNIADFERSYREFKVRERLRSELEFGAELVVLAIGENIPAPANEADEQALLAALGVLLGAFAADGDSTLVVRSSFFPHAVKDRLLREAAAGNGALFVDISGLAEDEANYARSERTIAHAGVASHPGDRGMAAIAAAILGALGFER